MGEDRRLRDKQGLDPFEPCPAGAAIFRPNPITDPDILDVFESVIRLDPRSRDEAHLARLRQQLLALAEPLPDRVARAPRQPRGLRSVLGGLGSRKRGRPCAGCHNPSNRPDHDI